MVSEVLASLRGGDKFLKYYPIPNSSLIGQMISHRKGCLNLTGNFLWPIFQFRTSYSLWLSLSKGMWQPHTSKYRFSALLVTFSDLCTLYLQTITELFSPNLRPKSGLTQYLGQIYPIFVKNCVKLSEIKPKFPNSKEFFIQPVENFV